MGRQRTWQGEVALGAALIACIAGCVAAAAPGPTAAPSPARTIPAELPDHVDVPLRFYSIDLPSGWTADVSSQATGADRYTGPQGQIEVRFAIVPANTGQDAWADAYFATSMAGRDGCAGLDPAKWTEARVGQASGRLYALPCKPGWMVLAAVGERAYDIRYTAAAVPDDTASLLFPAILRRVALDEGPAPSRATQTQAAARSDPLPDAFLGAWYHPSPAYWWFLRAGSPTCLEVAHTDGDCVAYEIGSQPAYVGAATMDGRVLRIRWTRGYCAGDRTNFGTGIAGDTLKLFDTEGDCGGENFVLTRAGSGATPSAPAPPES